MKFAITYQNGEVFQHYGQTREFKIFDTESDESEVVGAGEYSHGSLATLIKMLGVEVLICGGIGEGARNMLLNNGIKVYSGNKGNVDEIAASFKAGKLAENNASNCNHKHDCKCGH